MGKLRLFALTVQEGEMLARCLRDVPGSSLLRTHLLSGGFETYTGSVTDQDGDANWQITARFRSARLWAVQMSEVSFEKPRLYKVNVRRNGFGKAHAIDW